MKKYTTFILAVLLILTLLSGCNGRVKVSQNNSSASEITSSSSENYKLTYVAPPKFQKLGDREFDVLQLTISGNTPVFRDVGEVSKGKFRMEDITLRYSYSRPEYYYDEDTGLSYYTGRYQSDIPQGFWETTKNENGETICEGVIVFERVPFVFYYNEEGEPYVKCLETRFHSYFKEDKSYVDFVNFAINYEPVNYVTEEDLLSR
ncbi:MAG: hypothetical protein J6M16_07780 [Clostridia bacterium]|nr:hypothetical protein [Clostridia bacterium]